RVNTPLGIPVDLSLIRNSNDMKRAYRGLRLQAHWTPQRIDAGVHYTLATLRGNDDGESGTTGAVANVDPSLFYPEFFAYDRAALRTESAYSTDVALRYTRGRFFAQGDVLNIFNNDALFDPLRIGTTVTTAATSTTLQPFDPRTQSPVAGAHYQLAANFGQAL